MLGFSCPKETMLEKHLKVRGITDEKVLTAMKEVPREKFVLPEFQSLAYSDQPLPIEENQTISQPYIVALMAQALNIGPNDRVLDVGVGSGYAAAVLSQIAKHVYGIEYYPQLVAQAKKRLAELDYENISLKQGDGNLGWKEHAPYQGISVGAATTNVPTSLLEQLDINGRLVIPVGPPSQYQKLLCITKIAQDDYSSTDLGYVAFVPLLDNRHCIITD